MALKMSDDLRKFFEKQDVSREEQNSMDKWFSPAGDLEDDKYFSPAGDLEDNKYFSSAGDLENTVFLSKYNSKEEIVKYLSSVVSGEKYGSQKGLPYSSGNILVSFEELKKMVDSGDNIIKAECLDDSGRFISIEYESYGDFKNNNMGRGR